MGGNALRTLLTVLLACLLAFPAFAAAEEAALPEAPASLPAASSVDEVMHFLRYPPENETDSVQAGYIRYISQHRGNDAHFREAYWLGGEAGSDLDLTLKENRYGHQYTFYCSTMCTRAAYSMALSYLGVDVTPGGMSAMTGKRNINPPYDGISAELGVERVEPTKHVFNTMVDNYLTDPSYSPVYVYLRKPDGQDHALLVVAALPEKSRYLVVDPAGMWADGVDYRVYMMSFNKTRQQVVNSTFRDEYAGSKVMQLYQWRKLPAGEPAIE